MPRIFQDEAEKHITDPLERLKDVAKEFDCSERFLKDEAKRGRLKIVRLSHQVLRIRRSEKLRYLAERETGGQS